MKELKKRVMSIVLAIALVLPILSVPKRAEAADMYYPPSIDLICGGAYSARGRYINGFPSNGTIKNVKNSDKSVVTPKIGGSSGNKYILYYPKKPGKSTVEFDVIYGSKKQHFKTKVTVRKYVNPLKSFKLNEEDFTELLDKKGQCTFDPGNAKKLKYKVSAKAKSGWVIDRIYYTDGQGKSTTVKNNGSFTYKSTDKYPHVYIECHKKSNPKYVIECNLYVKIRPI